jgi:hypothetical protein
MASVPDELILSTFSARRLDRLIVFVNHRGREVADDDWNQYIQWLKALQALTPELSILTAPDGRAPSSTQRALLNRELVTDNVRLAVLLSDPKLVAIVRVSSWFMKGAEPFRAHELEKALAYLGQGDPARVRATIRELGGVVYKAAH